MTEATVSMRRHLQITFTTGILFLGLLSGCPALSADSLHVNEAQDLSLRITFLDDPPYKRSWWPWSKPSFRIKMSICNDGDSVWNIERIWPCYDCNPKLFLEDAATGEAAKRVSERDAFYVYGKHPLFELAPTDCYVDTIDVAEWVKYDLHRGSRYRFWIEYWVWASDDLRDSTNSVPVWRERLVSDSLEFVY